MNKKEVISCITIFCAALMLRVMYSLFLEQHYFHYNNPSSDVLYYLDWAEEISRGHWIGSKTFWGLPLYPYFLAVLERLSLGHLFLIRLFHLLLGALNCVLIYFMTRKLFSRNVAVLAGILAAINFMLIYYDWLLMPVTLIMTLSLIIALALLEKDKIRTKREWFFLGVILGLSILGDGKFLLFLGFILISFCMEYRTSIREKAKLVLVPVVSGVLLILCMTGVRNKLVGGDWIWITAQSGLSFYVGNNPQASGVYDNPPFIRPNHTGQDEDQVIMAEVMSGRQLTPGQVSRFWFNQGLTFIKNAPWAYLKLLKNKFVLFFTETEAAFDLDLLFQKDWKQKWDINPFYIFFPFAVWGIILTRKRRRDLLYIDLMILSQLCFTLIFFLADRHRAAIIPFLLMYESYVIFWIIEKIKHKNFKAVLLTAVFCILFFLVFRPQSLDPKAVVFYNLSKSGSTYGKKKDYLSARTQYLKALDIRPDDTDSLYNLANTYVYTGNFPEAERYYQKLLHLNPYQVDALYNLGFVYAQTGRLENALSAFQRVLQLQKDSADALFQTAQIYQRQDNCPEAVRYYQHVIHIKPMLTQKINEIISLCQ